jgi:hypothetical protein
MKAVRSAPLTVLALALLLCDCSGAAAPPSATVAMPSQPPAASSTAAPSRLLVSVERRGGLCAAEATCDTTTSIDTDGRIHLAAKPPNDLGTASPGAIIALRSAIASTDFAALRAPAFSGTCPSAYDGQELVFEFVTDQGVERLASCESALDLRAPVFVALAAALGGASPIAP